MVALERFGELDLRMAESQREAVFFLSSPLLTALPSARLTSRSWAEICSPFLVSITCRAFLIRVLSFDRASLLTARFFKLCRCRLIADG